MENKALIFKDTVCTRLNPNGYAEHRAKFAQLVTERIKKEVLRTFGEDAIKANTDPCFNPPPFGAGVDRLSLGFALIRWTKLSYIVTGGSLSQKISVLKEAARQIKEELANNG